MSNNVDYEVRKRVIDSHRIVSKYSDYIPVIIKSNGINIKKTKFLVPDSVNVGHLLYAVRKHITLDSSKAIFLFCNNSLICGSSLMRDVYDKHVTKRGGDDDLFLYVTMSMENTFG